MYCISVLEGALVDVSCSMCIGVYLDLYTTIISRWWYNLFNHRLSLVWAQESRGTLLSSETPEPEYKR